MDIPDNGPPLGRRGNIGRGHNPNVNVPALWVLVAQGLRHPGHVARYIAHIAHDGRRLIGVHRVAAELVEMLRCRDRGGEYQHQVDDDTRGAPVAHRQPLERGRLGRPEVPLPRATEDQLRDNRGARRGLLPSKLAMVVLGKR